MLLPRTGRAVQSSIPVPTAAESSSRTTGSGCQGPVPSAPAALPVPAQERCSSCLHWVLWCCHGWEELGLPAGRHPAQGAGTPCNSTMAPVPVWLLGSLWALPVLRKPNLPLTACAKEEQQCSLSCTFYTKD